MTRKQIVTAVGLASCFWLGLASAAETSTPAVLTTAQLDSVTAAGMDGDGGDNSCKKRGNHGQYKGSQCGGKCGGTSVSGNQANIAALNNISVLSGNGIGILGKGTGGVAQGVSQGNLLGVF